MDWMYEKLKKEFPRLSLGTVYRNMNILIEQGLVKKIQSGSTFDRFEANMSTHYHLICETCGRIIDFEMPVQKDLNVQANQMTDFEVKKHRIDFFGICSSCREKERIVE